MAFFDDYQDTGGWNFVSKEEKEVLIKEGVAFVPESVVFNENGKFGAKYTVLTRLPDDPDEVRAISFTAGTVQSRDRLLDALTTYLEQEDAEAPRLKLERNKQSILIRNADAAE